MQDIYLLFREKWREYVLRLTLKAIFMYNNLQQCSIHLLIRIKYYACYVHTEKKIVHNSIFDFKYKISKLCSPEFRRMKHFSSHSTFPKVAFLDRQMQLKDYPLKCFNKTTHTALPIPYIWPTLACLVH